MQSTYICIQETDTCLKLPLLIRGLFWLEAWEIAVLVLSKRTIHDMYCSIHIIFIFHDKNFLTKYYVQRKKRFRKGGSNSTFSILRKELRDGNLQSLFGGSSGKVTSSNTEADPLLSSFISNLALADDPVRVQSHHSVEPSSIKITTDDNMLLERYGYCHYPY